MRVTMEDVARAAGVSKATVSRVLNFSSEGVGEETRNRVMKVANDLHYSLMGGEKKCFFGPRLIALIVPDISNPFFASIAKSVEAQTNKMGYVLVICNTDFSEDQECREIEKLTIGRLAGIIFIPSGTRLRPEHLLPNKHGIPMVLLDRKLEGCSEYYGVYSNNEYAAVISCNRLIQNGSRRIAYISGPLNTSTAIERQEGYKAVLKQNNIPFNEEMCRDGGYTFEGGYRAVLDLERSGIQYTAILAANDLMAIGALKAVRELGYAVPEDIEIIGFDNIEFAQYSDPALSSVQQPTFEMGCKAVDLLIKIIKGEPVTQPERLVPRLVMRKTTR